MSRSALRVAASVEKVIDSHSSAICSAERLGSHARRPKAYQLAWAKSWPVQLVSEPVLATPAMPVMGFL
jgi:hypothetical protein